ncbi:MAG TPA: hypothetical protein VK586_14930 [Streptosporangiaceae bacterium]|nr:hypothetical protein [Streptosporangiaceae bacterium]
MADDKLAAALAEIRDRDQRVWDGRGNVGGLLAITEARDDTPRLLAAVGAVLEMHAPTRYVAYTEACSNHLFTILPRRTCPDCVRVERLGCQRCRDENGNPAKPEDCFERNVILAALTGEGNDGG